MHSQRLTKFMRITAQGICVASLGTMGISPTWGALIVGLGMFFVSMAFLTFEQED